MANNENSTCGRGCGHERKRGHGHGCGYSRDHEYESSEYNSSDNETDDIDNNNGEMDFMNISDIICDNYNGQRIFITFFGPFYWCYFKSNIKANIILSLNSLVPITMAPLLVITEASLLVITIAIDIFFFSDHGNGISSDNSCDMSSNNSNSSNYNRGCDHGRISSKNISSNSHSYGIFSEVNSSNSSNRSIFPENNSSNCSYGISLEDNNNNSTGYNRSSSCSIFPETNGSNYTGYNRSSSCSIFPETNGSNYCSHGCSRDHAHGYGCSHGMSSKNNNLSRPFHLNLVQKNNLYYNAFTNLTSFLREMTKIIPSHNCDRSLSISSDNNGDNNPGCNRDCSRSISSNDNSCNSSVYNHDSSCEIFSEDDGSNSHNHAMSPSHNSNNSPDCNHGHSCDTSENGSNSLCNMSPDNSDSNRSMSSNNNDSTCRGCKHGFLNNDNNNNRKLNILEAIQFISDIKSNRRAGKFTKNEEENLHQILSSEIVDTISGLTTYINGNEVVSTEELLDSEQIVELATQSVKFDSSSSDEELVLISYKEGLEALTTFIDYFGQQTDTEFKVEDLRTLKKYNNIVKRKYSANIKQKTLENFF
ncbi:CENP-b protein 1 [Gigaspora margarita]|uniref:CENP-b protein 1 n=1 Tax=Gigaspora margarita TaxID=4874 RepID=A0A8H4ACI8_GIGMA|nr:CENP-b protein 1 [Gigaspora margarita]